MRNTEEHWQTIAEDMLHGADKIAAFVGISKAQVYHAARLKTLPIGKFGWKLIASKRALERALRKFTLAD